VGEYRLSPQFSLRIFERAGRLMTQGTGQIAIPAEVSGTDRMENPAVGDVIDFQREPGMSSPWVMHHVRAGRGQVIAEVELAGFRFTREEPILRGNFFLRFRKP
jgi:hypothetical protein